LKVCLSRDAIAPRSNALKSADQSQEIGFGGSRRAWISKRWRRAKARRFCDLKFGGDGPRRVSGGEWCHEQPFFNPAPCAARNVSKILDCRLRDGEPYRPMRYAP
jgi:hypothetical protein